MATCWRRPRTPTRSSWLPASTWAPSAVNGCKTRCCATSRSSSRSMSSSASGMSVPASPSSDVFPALQINGALVRDILTGFIRNEVRKVGFQRVVLGLSGGVDSSVAATLAARALGPENVKALIMPYSKSDPKSRSDAVALASQLGIGHEEIDLSPQIDAYFSRFPRADDRRRGNKM